MFTIYKFIDKVLQSQTKILSFQSKLYNIFQSINQQAFNRQINVKLMTLFILFQVLYLETAL